MLLVRCQSGEFHKVWLDNFSSEYTRISISQLNSQSNCALCGQQIYKQVGRLELTGRKQVSFKNDIVSLPDDMLIGCDCYANKLGPVLKIVEKLQLNFNYINVPIVEDKIDLLKLIVELVNYKINYRKVNPYKLLIPVKYLYCDDFENLKNCMNFTKWTQYYQAFKSKKNWSDVVFNPTQKPMSKVKPGNRVFTKEDWESIFSNPDFIIVINEDMIDNTLKEYKMKRRTK